MFDVWRLVSSAAQFGWFHDKAYLARSTVWLVLRQRLVSAFHALVSSTAQLGWLYSTVWSALQQTTATVVLSPSPLGLSTV